MQTHIKVNGKTSNLGNTVTVSRDDKKLKVSAEAPFAKRYLKYLSKRFLKHKEGDLRNYLHVVSVPSAKGAESMYEVRFYNINTEEDAEEED